MIEGGDSAVGFTVQAATLEGLVHYRSSREF